MSLDSARQRHQARIFIYCRAGLHVLGCSSSALTSDQSAALAAGEARWKKNAIRDYSFEIHPMTALSFGHNAGRIEVRGGVVKTVTRLSYLDPPRMTIDELFANIHSLAKSRNYAKIEATYDPRLGYPTQIIYTTHKGVTDGNGTIKITGFKDLKGQ